MRRTIQTFFATTAALLGAAMCSAGCDRSCHANATCEYVPLDTCPEDPAHGEVPPDCGVWVSASTGDDGHEGTQAAPVKTLYRALEIATGPGGTRRVYACGGVYAEHVDVAGVSLFGGFDCGQEGEEEEGKWVYRGADRLAEIQAPPEPAALVLLAHETVSVLSDLRVRAGDGAWPGGSSIGVLALEGAGARFRRAEILAGDGADGAHGEAGSHNGQPAMAGLSGKDGADACTADEGLGGFAVTAVCSAGTSSTGGSGGHANDVAANDGLDGSSTPDLDLAGFGVGGKGENAARDTLCTGGQHGAHGEPGPDGNGGIERGRLTKDGYVGTAGEDGRDGLPGQGGGGGGASLGGAVCAAAGWPVGGAAGGSGGSGGCGGKRGKGGQAGGASIGLGSLSDRIVLEEVFIVAGKGGKAGHGGGGQQGGQSGLPGKGGYGYGGAGGPKAACNGGSGGKGGDGGAGGGGRGGHAASIAATSGKEPLKVGGFTLEFGEAGAGGMGGKPLWNSGQYGLQSTQIELDE